MWFPALFLVQIWVTNGGKLGQGLPQSWAPHYAWGLRQRWTGSYSRKRISLTSSRLLYPKSQFGHLSNWNDVT